MSRDYKLCIWNQLCQCFQQPALPFGVKMKVYLTNGDGGIGAIRMAKKPVTPSALDNTDAAVKAQKRLENGMLLIEKNGKVYNVMGQPIR